MEEHTNTTPLIIGVVVALSVGLLGGYFYGRTQGKAAILSQEQAELERAQEELAQQANPFAAEEAAVNPFDGGYQNPFAGVNPFAQ